jgi:site-specific DNA-cytosine methylase
MRVLEIFAGAGGAALGLEAAGFTHAALVEWDVIRKLTVRECSAIQGFPVDYPFCGRVMSQYRQVGNAVPPRLAEAVARVIARAQEGAA